MCTCSVKIHCLVVDLLSLSSSLLFSLLLSRRNLRQPSPRRWSR